MEIVTQQKTFVTLQMRIVTQQMKMPTLELIGYIQMYPCKTNFAMIL